MLNLLLLSEFGLLVSELGFFSVSYYYLLTSLFVLCLMYMGLFKFRIFSSIYSFSLPDVESVSVSEFGLLVSEFCFFSISYYNPRQLLKFRMMLN